MKRRPGPPQTKVNMVALTPLETSRLRAFVRKHGMKVSRLRLGVANITFDNAMEYGLMRPMTRDKVLESLQREEDKDAGDAGLATGSTAEEAISSATEASGTGGVLRDPGTEEGRGAEGL